MQRIGGGTVVRVEVRKEARVAGGSWGGDEEEGKERQGLGQVDSIRVLLLVLCDHISPHSVA